MKPWSAPTPRRCAPSPPLFPLSSLRVEEVRYAHPPDRPLGRRPAAGRLRLGPRGALWARPDVAHGLSFRPRAPGPGGSADQRVRTRTSAPAGLGQLPVALG